MSKKLFISHSTKDDAQVDRISDALEAAGFTVWVDHRHGIEPGAPNWDKAIRDAIVEADAGIFLMSERSLASDICSAECLLVRELEDPLYVMRLEACKPENIWLYIKQIQYADLVKDFDKGINDLIRVLGGETSEELPKAVRATFTGLDTMRLYLPYLNNPLRGRDEDIKQIQSKLGAHVLQIVGPGGLGKSRLAAEIAMNQPDGAIWHRCSPVSEPADLLALLREHLKLPADASLTNVLVLLSEKKPLIVVDNAEDVPDGSDKRRAYANLLQQIVGRGVPVSLTTRAVWTELKPRRDYAPEAVSLETAAQIALDFAAAEDIELSESQARELAEKAQLHPRLIEFSVGQLHERRLDSVLRQLSELKHADIKEALDEMITKTVEQMAAQAKHGADAETLLRRMTILQATFPLDAIKAIAPNEMKEDTDRLEDALVTLQRWQFVRHDVSTERYSLGELVREALGQPINDDAFWLYASYFTRRSVEIFTEPRAQWKNHDHDLSNILAVGDALVERIPSVITKTGVREEAEDIWLDISLFFALGTHFFVVRCIEYRRVSWLEMGLVAAQAKLDRRAEGVFLNELGLVWSALGEKYRALEYLKQVLPILRATDDWRSTAALLNNIGGILEDLEEIQNALEHYRQALRIFRKMENWEGQATSLNNIGMLWSSLGNKPRALRYLMRALRICRKIENCDNDSMILNNIGLIWNSLGKRRKALNFYRRALAISEETGDQAGKAKTLTNIGGIWFALGNQTRALKYAMKAAKLTDEIGDLFHAFVLYVNIGTAYAAVDDIDAAIDAFDRATAIGKQAQHPKLPNIEATLIEFRRRRDSGTV